MNRQVGRDKDNGCTLIESAQGAVKLIRRADDVNPALIICNFSSLADCMEYVQKNRFQVKIIHSGSRRTREESKRSEGI